MIPLEKRYLTSHKYLRRKYQKYSKSNGQKKNRNDILRTIVLMVNLFLIYAGTWPCVLSGNGDLFVLLQVAHMSQVNCDFYLSLVPN